MSQPESPARIRVGCAGWSIPRLSAGSFPERGHALQRYAARLRAVEINSSFHRPHRPETYARWASMVPEVFRFSVKAPKQLTHQGRLRDLTTLESFLGQVRALGPGLDVILVQLPPSLAFEAETAAPFFTEVRSRWDDALACEPRHPSWFSSEAEGLMVRWRVARVAADPAPVPGCAEPGGWPGLVYFRLHGSPRRYYSAYSPEFLGALAGKASSLAANAEVWCIFDNTAGGAAIRNALDLCRKLEVQTG